VESTFNPEGINHLSTAECIAHVLRIVEDGAEQIDVLFDTRTLIKPLDLIMVKQWHSFFQRKRDNKISQRKILS
jgi:hypothetical protein